MIENYTKLRPGHWYQMFQTGPCPKYDKNYVDTRYNLYKTTGSLSKLRYNLLISILKNFNTICDFGYGNGDFLNFCKSQGHTCYGYDISDYALPDSIERIYTLKDYKFDVITFFDSLEHKTESDLVSFLLTLNVKYICISVPHFHEELGPNWFTNWKHRRLNEHFHHFDSHGLIGLLEEANFSVVHVGNNEDVIRTPVDDKSNILTVIARKI
jgi:hypothetical protein